MRAAALAGIIGDTSAYHWAGRCHVFTAALLLSFVGSAAARSLAASNDDITQGISTITPQAYPIPSGWRYILRGGHLIYGSTVIQQRVQLEKNFLAASTQVQDPSGFTIRYLNWTAYPSLSPGLERYSAIVEHIGIYSDELAVPRALYSAQAIAFAAGAIANSAAQAGTPSKIILQWTHQTNIPGQTNITAANTLEILSRIELQGYGLQPFHFDKQTLFIESIYIILLADQAPVGQLNISNWQKAESPATNGGRRLRASAQPDVLQLDVWMTVYPTYPITAQQLWSNLSSPDPRLWNATGAHGYPMNVTFLNATTYLRAKGAKFATVTYSTNSAATSGAFSARNAGLSTAALIGIVLGAVAFVGIVALLLLTWLLWRRRRQMQAQPQSTKRASSSALSDTDSMSQALGLIDPSEIAICQRPDGSDWLLGQGTYGQVYKAVRRGTTEVAVKKLNCHLVSEEQLYQMRKEVAILRKVSYDGNIVQFYGVCLPDPAMLCMEFMEGGDLRDALWRELRHGTHEYDWYAKGKTVALAVARGLHFLHTSGVIHRDVKSSNILLTKEGVAKVADVGLAYMTGAFSSAATGAFNYAAPELLMGQKCTPKVDTFSYGVLLWEIVTKEQPQRGHLRTMIAPQECPAEIEQLMQSCLLPDAAERPSMKEIIECLCASDGIDTLSSFRSLQTVDSTTSMSTLACTAQADSDDSKHFVQSASSASGQDS